MASIREYETREYLTWLELHEAMRSTPFGSRRSDQALAEHNLARSELEKALARRQVMEDAKLSRAERRGRQSDR